MSGIVTVTRGGAAATLRGVVCEIVLVNPPDERIAPGYEFVRQVTNRSPSQQAAGIVRSWRRC